MAPSTTALNDDFESSLLIFVSGMIWKTRCFLPCIVIVFPDLSTAATVPWKGSPRPCAWEAAARALFGGGFVAARIEGRATRTVVRINAKTFIRGKRSRTNGATVRMARSFRRPSGRRSLGGLRDEGRLRNRNDLRLVPGLRCHNCVHLKVLTRQGH